MRAIDIAAMPTRDLSPVILEWGEVHRALQAFVDTAAPHLSQFWREAQDADDSERLAELTREAGGFAFAVKAGMEFGCGDDSRDFGVGVLEVDGVAAAALRWNESGEWKCAILDAVRAEAVLAWADACHRRPLAADPEASFSDFAYNLNYRLTAGGYEATGAERLAHITHGLDGGGAVLAALADGAVVLWSETGIAEFPAGDEERALAAFFVEVDALVAEIGQQSPRARRRDNLLFCHMERGGGSFALQKQNDAPGHWLVNAIDKGGHNLRDVLNTPEFAEAAPAFRAEVETALRQQLSAAPAGPRP
jgi:hypothetical protein